METATPLQRRANEAHLMRLAKIAARAVPDMGISLKPHQAGPHLSTDADIKQWKQRQEKIHAPFRPWFEIVDVIDLGPKRPPSIAEIQIITAAHYKVTRGDILSPRRTADVVRPRQVAMYLAKTMTLSSMPMIGRKFGGRDHTTALHAFRKIERLVETDDETADAVAAIKAELAA